MPCVTDGGIQFQPIQLGAYAREHDFSGYWHAGGVLIFRTRRSIVIYSLRTMDRLSGPAGIQSDFRIAGYTATCRRHSSISIGLNERLGLISLVENFLAPNQKTSSIAAPASFLSCEITDEVHLPGYVAVGERCCFRLGDSKDARDEFYDPKCLTTRPSSCASFGRKPARFLREDDCGLLTSSNSPTRSSQLL